jgi:CheY-like chemotaxis protein
MVSRKAYKILVVDDDPVIRGMMVDILEFEGYLIQIARNGREALDILHGNENYLVFLDLMMPIMNGRELCLALNTEPQWRACHILVVMSALDNLSQVASLGVDAIMPKPFAVEDVLGIVNTYISPD